MPFAPTVSDQSGLLLAQGISTAGGAVAQGMIRSKEQQRADKEKAKQESEARARLLQIADALGVPGAEHMSTGQLSGVIDAETVKHARKVESDRQAFETTRLGLDVAQANRADRAMGQTDAAMARAAADNAAATQALTGAMATPESIRRPGAALNIYAGQGGTDFATAQKLMEVDRLLQGSRLAPPTYQNVGPGVAVVDPGTGKPQVVQLPTPAREPQAASLEGTYATPQEALTAATQVAAAANIGANRLRLTRDEKSGRFYFTVGGESAQREDPLAQAVASANSPAGQAAQALKVALDLENNRPWFNAESKIRNAKLAANATAQAAGQALPFPEIKGKETPPPQEQTPAPKSQPAKETKAPATLTPAEAFGGF